MLCAADVNSLCDQSKLTSVPFASWSTMTTQSSRWTDVFKDKDNVAGV